MDPKLREIGEAGKCFFGEAIAENVLFFWRFYETLSHDMKTCGANGSHPARCANLFSVYAMNTKTVRGERFDDQHSARSCVAGLLSEINLALLRMMWYW